MLTWPVLCLLQAPPRPRQIIPAKSEHLRVTGLRMEETRPGVSVGINAAIKSWSQVINIFNKHIWTFSCFSHLPAAGFEHDIVHSLIQWLFRSVFSDCCLATVKRSSHFTHLNVINLC